LATPALDHKYGKPRSLSLIRLQVVKRTKRKGLLTLTIFATILFTLQFRPRGSARFELAIPKRPCKRLLSSQPEKKNENFKNDFYID
jgi:hypothetical protein